MLAKLNVTMVSLPYGEQFRYYTHRDYLPSLAESKSLILFISWNKKNLWSLLPMKISIIHNLMLEMRVQNCPKCTIKN